MADSFNEVNLIGNVGGDPIFRKFSDQFKEDGGDKEIATFSIATSESWIDKKSNDRAKKSVTEWHKIVVQNEALVRVVKLFVKKGSKVFLKGKLTNRKWKDKDGIERMTTEIKLGAYNSSLILLSGSNAGTKDRYGDESSISSANNFEGSNEFSAEDGDFADFMVDDQRVGGDNSRDFEEDKIPF